MKSFITLLTLLLALSLVNEGKTQIIQPAEPRIAFKRSVVPLESTNWANWVPDTPQKVDMLANAIFWAEGGENTNFPYGIKSINCEGHDECRKIAENTIKNNIQRFRQAQTGGYGKPYLSFLQERFCPTSGDTLTDAEKELNGNWLSNVLFFLNKGGRTSNRLTKNGCPPRR